MKEKIEFGKVTYIEENPNPKNDIYNTNWGVSCIINAILSIIGLIIFLSDDASGIINDVIPCLICLCLLWGSARGFYEEYPGRKKIMQNGTACPGVIIREFHYESGKRKVKLSGIEIRYFYKGAKIPLIIRGLEREPSVHLENPYCTVYEWKGKKVAADFKVRDEYITDKGLFNPYPSSKD